MSFSSKQKLRKRLRGEKRTEELLSTVSVASTHKGTAASVLYPEDKNMPTVQAVGQSFFYRAWWPTRKLLAQMCAWARTNPGAIPTLQIVTLWCDEANCRYQEIEKEYNELLNVARLPDTATKRTIKAVVGGVIHECLHKVYTPQVYLVAQDVYDVIIPRWAEIQDWSKYEKLLLENSNIAEDIKIERLGCGRFGGIHPKMEDLQDFILSMEEESREQAAKLGIETPAIGVLMSTFRDLGLGYDTMLQRQALKAYSQINEEAYKMVTEGCLKPVLDASIPKCSNREEIEESRNDVLSSTRIAMDIIIAIDKAGMQPEDNDNGKPEGKVQCQSCGAPSDRLRSHYHPTDDTKIIITCLDCGHQIEMDKPQQGGGGGGDCEGGDISIELPPEGNQPPGKPGKKPKDTIKWGGEDFEKPKGDSESDGDGDESDAQIDTSKETEFSANDRRKGKSGMSEKEQSDDQSGKGSDDGDQNQSEADKDGSEGDDVSTQGDDKGDSSDGSEEGSTGSEEGSDKGDSTANDGSDNDDGSTTNGDQSDNGDNNSESADSEGEESSRCDGDTSNENPSKKYQPGGQGGDADAKGHTIADIIRQEVANGTNTGMLDMNSAIEGQAVKEDVKENKGLKKGEQKWNPWTTEQDEIRWAKGSKRTSKEMMKDVRKECRYLLARLRTIVQGMEETLVDDGVKKGRKLSSRNLVNTYMQLSNHENPDRAFRMETEECAPDCAVAVVVDESGSMRSMIEDAGKCAMAIAEPMSKLGAAVQVSGITSNSWISCDTQSPNAHRHYSVVYNMVKDYDEPMQACIDRFSGLRASGGTPLADGIEFAYRGIRNRPEARKIIFVITDGQPDGGHLPVMKYQRRICKEEGIILIGVGIGYEATYVSSCFDESVHAYNISELPKKLIKILQRMITRKAKRVA